MIPYSFWNVTYNKSKPWERFCSLLAWPLDWVNLQKSALYQTLSCEHLRLDCFHSSVFHWKVALYFSIVCSLIWLSTMSLFRPLLASPKGLTRLLEISCKAAMNKKRRLHGMKWEVICGPRNQGGLGIRMSSEMNQALLANGGGGMHLLILAYGNQWLVKNIVKAKAIG